MAAPQTHPRALFVTALLVLALLSALGSDAGAATISIVAGTGAPGFSPDGSPAKDARLNNPYGITHGPDGSLYVCDMGNQVIRRIDLSGKIRTVAGSGVRGYSGDGGPALSARLNEPYEVRFDHSGNMFFVERLNHVVRRVDARTGNISTVAGTGKPGFDGDTGPAMKATLKEPHSLQFDSAGNLFVCDIGNHRVRKIDLKAGTIVTVGGTGKKSTPQDGGLFPVSPLAGPRALDFDRSGALWLALREGNAIYKIDMTTQELQRRAGTGQTTSIAQASSALGAVLAGPKGIAVGPDGNIYFADTESHSIRMLDRKRGTLELIAGTGERGHGPDGDPLRCRLNRPHGIFVAQDRTLFIGDSENHVIRKIVE